MRQKVNLQTTIFEIFDDHPFAKELEAISKFLDAHPRILHWVSRDLIDDSKRNTGRFGFTVDTMLRAAIIKNKFQVTYEALAFQISDSRATQAFCRVYRKTPSASALQDCISRITSKTWGLINKAILDQAVINQVENGQVIRTDSTVMESHIYKPRDSRLLQDLISSMIRLLDRAKGWFGRRVVFRNCCRAVKGLVRRLEGKKAPIRKLYGKLLGFLEITIASLTDAQQLVATKDASKKAHRWLEQVVDLFDLAAKVAHQTRVRVFEGGMVPAKKKIVSIFEPHTDVIVKKGRTTEYGHKLNLTTGRSGMVIDLVVEDGNPADSKTAVDMVDRVMDLYGRPPKQVSFDGGYASRKNLELIKGIGVKDVAFHKRRGLSVKEMATSEWIYKKLIRFRAGIEGNIGTLKNRYGWKRCNWRGWERFQAYAWLSVVTYNLGLLVRLSP